MNSKNVLNFIAASFILLLTINPSMAYSFVIYSIDGKYKAAFPEPPGFNGTLKKNGVEVKSYSYEDYENHLAYTATYQVNKTIYKKKEISQALKYYITGIAMTRNAEIISDKIYDVNKYKSIKYKMSYLLGGLNMRRYGIVSYKDGQFYGWAISEAKNISKLSAEKLFKDYVKYFSVNDLE